MLRNVAGAHIQTITDLSRQLFTKKAGCIKVCHPAFSVDLMAQFHATNPASPACFRLIDDSSNFDNMRAKTQDAINLFKPVLNVMPGDLVYVEILPNEHYTDGAELERLGHMSIPCAEDIFHAGMRPVMLNLPVGNPPNPASIALVHEPAHYICADLKGAIGYHNYTIPGNQLDKNLDLRHELMAQHLTKDISWWLNEGMYDHGIIDGRLAGWRDETFHQSAEDVSRYTRSIAQHLSADPTVIGWTPFGAGPTNDWWSFQYDNEPVILQVFTELYDVAVAPQPPQVGPGFQRMIPYLGMPLENEVYHFAGTPLETSLCVFENGVANWYRASNETVGQRSDGAIFTDRGNNGDGSTVWVAWEP